MVTELITQVLFEINSFLNTSPTPPTNVITFHTPRPEVFILPADTSIPLPSRKPKPAVKSAQTKATTITVQSVLKALNNYRSKNGTGNLQIDNTVQDYAQSRVDYLKSLGKLDKHAGHNQFMSNNGFSRLGFNSIAENQSWNYQGDSIGLIENFYGKSPGHNKNQLNGEYTHIGIGINGVFTNLVFGGRKK